MFEVGDIVRFKTEEEFWKEFGRDWEYKVEGKWISNMGYLFGRFCTIKSFNPYNELRFHSLEGIEETWIISTNMVKLYKVNED